ncbi:hypothetical protein WKH82_08360 [Acinetobacter baumannii]|nr:hypothetical protein [Acinetobacter baumannii]
MNYIERQDRTVNGKLKGRFYTMPNGQKLYLEHTSGEKTRLFDVKNNAWVLTTQAIREAEHRGCTAIGILHRVGKKKHVYLTNIQDYLNEPSEAHWVSGKEPMRRLAKIHFKVNTTLSSDYIENCLKIR